MTRGQFRQFVNDSRYKTDPEKGGKPRAEGWNAQKKQYEYSKDYSWRNTGFRVSLAP